LNHVKWLISEIEMHALIWLVVI